MESYSKDTGPWRKAEKGDGGLQKHVDLSGQIVKYRRTRLRLYQSPMKPAPRAAMFSSVESDV